MVPWINYWKKLKAGYNLINDARKGGIPKLAKTLATMIAKNAHGIIKDTGKLAGNIAGILETAAKTGNWLVADNMISQIGTFAAQGLRLVESGSQKLDFLGNFGK